MPIYSYLYLYIHRIVEVQAPSVASAQSWKSNEPKFKCSGTLPGSFTTNGARVTPFSNEDRHLIFVVFSLAAKSCFLPNYFTAFCVHEFWVIRGGHWFRGNFLKQTRGRFCWKTLFLKELSKMDTGVRFLAPIQYEYSESSKQLLDYLPDHVKSLDNHWNIICSLLATPHA